MHVAVLGAGYAGLAVARQLEGILPEGVDLTLVDESDTHLVQHLVHRVIRRPDLADELTPPIASLIDRADHRQNRVAAVDPDAGLVEFANGADLEYDVGAVCLGARTDFHDVPGVAENATPLKRLTHAQTIRDDFLDLCNGGSPRQVVVGGAGLSGVQVAGELAALAREQGAGDAVKICLVEQADHVAPTLPASFQRAITAELRDSGVTVETGLAVRRANSDTIELSDGTERATDQFVWTGGITGPGALGEERPEVRARLRLGERTFGLGDAVQVIDAAGARVPPSAKTALGQAPVATTNVRRLVDYHGEGANGFEPRLEAYRYDVRTWLVTVGDGAVATVGSGVLRGRVAKRLKTAVSRRYLTTVDPERDLAGVVLSALEDSGL